MIVIADKPCFIYAQISQNVFIPVVGTEAKFQQGVRGVIKTRAYFEEGFEKMWYQMRLEKSQQEYIGIDYGGKTMAVFEGKE